MEKEGPLKFHGKRRYLVFQWKNTVHYISMEKEGPLKFHGKRRYLIYFH